MSSPDIWRVMVFISGHENPIALTFNGENIARKAKKDLTDPGSIPVSGGQAIGAFIDVADQYGCELTVRYADVQGAFLSHVAQELEGNVLVSLAQARAQAKANRDAQNDATINSPLARPTMMMSRG